MKIDKRIFGTHLKSQRILFKTLGLDFHFERETHPRKRHQTEKKNTTPASLRARNGAKDNPQQQHTRKHDLTRVPEWKSKPKVFKHGSQRHYACAYQALR